MRSALFAAQIRRLLGATVPTDPAELARALVATALTSPADAERQIAAILEVTDRSFLRDEQVEAKLRQSADRNRDLAQLVNDWYWETDAEHRISYQLATHAEAPSLARRGIARWDQDGIQPDDPYWAAHRKDLAERRPFRDFEFRRRGPGGAWIWRQTTGVPAFNDDGTFVGYRGVARDITARKNIEEALQRALLESETLAAVVAATDNSIVLTDPDGRITWVNESFSKLTGWTLLEVQRRTPHEVLAGPVSDARVSEKIRLARDRGEPCQIEQQVYHRDGRMLWLEVELIPVRDDTGRIARWLTVHADISERKEMEQELRLAKQSADEANQAKSSFLANMSHELRTPMNGVLGMTQLALGTELTPEQREYLQTVHSSADALLAILNDVLDLSKIEAGHMTMERISFPLRKLLSDTLRSVAIRAHEKGLDLVFDVAGHVPELLLGDATRIRQVLTNLVGNAIKFTSRGAVEIRVDASRPDVNEPLTVTIAVTDSGVGIDERQQQRLFQAFSQGDASITRRYGGTGLGLTISRQLARLMGGDIVLASVAGQGSTFSFSFGAAEDPAASTASADREFDQRPTALDDFGPSGIRVLLVTERATTARVIGELIGRWGSVAKAVDTPSGAFTVTADAIARGEPFALALVDGDLADGQGLQVAQLLGARYSLESIALLSTTQHLAGAALARRVGIAAHILKPVGARELAAAASAILTAKVSGKVNRAAGFSGPLPGAIASARAAVVEGVAIVARDVLLVEDNAVNRRVAVRLLERDGHRVVVADNGEAGLQLFKQQRFHLVLMDVQMPVMDGLAATRAIRLHERDQRWHRTPIVAMTANAMQGDREKCFAAGMDDHLTKPFHADDLARIVAQARRTD